MKILFSHQQDNVRKNKLRQGEGGSSNLNYIFQTIDQVFWLNWLVKLNLSSATVTSVELIVCYNWPHWQTGWPNTNKSSKTVTFCLVTFLTQIYFETCFASVRNAFLLLLLNCHVGMQNKCHPAVLWPPQTLRYLGDKYSKHVAGGVSGLKQVLYSQPGDNPNFLVCERRKSSGSHLLS